MMCRLMLFLKRQKKWVLDLGKGFFMLSIILSPLHQFETQVFKDCVFVEIQWLHMKAPVVPVMFRELIRVEGYWLSRFPVKGQKKVTITKEQCDDYSHIQMKRFSHSCYSSFLCRWPHKRLLKCICPKRAFTKLN